MSSNYKVAIVCICLNEPYWQYLPPMIESARKFLLKGHDVEFICWTDMPEGTKIDAKIIPTRPFSWPIPTLHRYHLFLEQEELLREYDFVYYVDADMKFVGRVGDEILGDLVAAEHPMYSVRREHMPPYEPNPNSTAYIPRIGQVEVVEGQAKFRQMYFAGGFQGGRTDTFISAMKKMRDMIDEDFTKNNYVAIWNDESYWNKYCLENPPTVALSPSYVYPDSLVNEYYRKVWGRNYVPRLMTITKKFSLSQKGASEIQNKIADL